MTRNEEMAVILRAAAEGAKPDGFPFGEGYSGGGRGGAGTDGLRHMGAAAYEAALMTARILNAMADVYEAAAKAETAAVAVKV